jgi:hypothetical protein
MKFAFAAIRIRCIELTAVTAGIPIQTPKKPTESAVSAKHSKNAKQPTVSHQQIKCGATDPCKRSGRISLFVDLPLDAA